MNLCFILPKYGVSLDDPCCYALGAMYVVAGLKRFGHRVDVFNMNLSEEMPRPSEYDALLMTGGQEFLSFVRQTAQACREVGVRTVLGGALATFMSEEMARIVDTVVVGEGDGVDVAALRPGIFNAPPVDIHSVPWPDYESFGVEEYHRRHSMRYMGVLTARGCPFRCSFCVQTCRYRERNLADVFAEIDHYQKRYRIESLVVNDNTLNVRKSRFLAFCMGMKGRGLAWSAAIRTDRMDESMVVAAKESGCQYFVVGVESFQQDRLDKMGKRTTVADNVRTLDLLHKHGVNYHGNVLVGFEWDDGTELSREMPMIRRYNVFPCLLYPFIGIKAKVGVVGKERERQSEMYMGYARSAGLSTYPEVSPC